MPSDQPAHLHTYYDLELAFTADRIWVELSCRTPRHGRTVWDSWGMLRPKAALTEELIRSTFWEASLELLSRGPNA